MAGIYGYVDTGVHDHAHTHTHANDHDGANEDDDLFLWVPTKNDNLRRVLQRCCHLWYIDDGTIALMIIVKTKMIVAGTPLARVDYDDNDDDGDYDDDYDDG